MASKSDFSEFKRQSSGAIAIAVLKYFETVVRQAIWPLLIVYFFGSGTDSFTRMIIYVTLFLGVFSIISAVFRYFYFFFCVRDGKLNVKSGVITAKNLSIPFEKIQRVEYEQNIVHRLLGIVTVRIETAGAEEEEVEISALSLDEADQLRSILLSGKKEATSENGVKEERSDPIFSLTLMDLLKAGFLRNHLQTAGLVFGFLVGIYFQFQEVLDLEEIYAEYIPQWYYSSDMMSWLILVFPIGLVLVIGISLIRTVLQYFGFKMWRKDKGYQVSYGAFNRSTYSSLDSKVQFLFWKDNVLMRRLGMYTAAIYQAGSVALRRRQAIPVPFCYMSHIERISKDIFKEYESPDDISYKAHNAYRGLLIFRYGVIPAVVGLSIAWLAGAALWTYSWLLVWLLAVTLWSFPYLRRMELRLNDRFLQITEGVFSEKTWTLEYAKLQSVSLTSNPFEARRHLKTLSFHSAAGDVVFPYVPEKDAQLIHNHILYQIEYKQLDWM